MVVGPEERWRQAIRAVWTADDHLGRRRRQVVVLLLLLLYHVVVVIGSHGRGGRVQVVLPLPQLAANQTNSDQMMTVTTRHEFQAIPEGAAVERVLDGFVDVRLLRVLLGVVGVRDHVTEGHSFVRHSKIKGTV